MKTNHIDYTRTTGPEERPILQELTADDFCKARYSHKDKRCYTARLLDIFLQEDKPYVAAYKEFRLATMDYLYEHYSEDHATTAEQRADVFNAVARRLGYDLVPAQTLRQSND